MHVRPYSPEDYPTLAAYWQTHHWPAVPAELLTTDGFVAVADGEPLACCWLFVADAAPLAFIEWLVTKPGISPLTAARAIDAVVEAALASARRSTVRAVFSLVRQPSLQRRYARHGFVVGDEAMTNMVCVLN